MNSQFRVVSVEAQCWSGNVHPFRGVVNYERTDASGTVTTGRKLTGNCKSEGAAVRAAQALAAKLTEPKKLTANQEQNAMTKLRAGNWYQVQEFIDSTPRILRFVKAGYRGWSLFSAPGAVRLIAAPRNGVLREATVAEIEAALAPKPEPTPEPTKPVGPAPVNVDLLRTNTAKPSPAQTVVNIETIHSLGKVRVQFADGKYAYLTLAEIGAAIRTRAERVAS